MMIEYPFHIQCHDVIIDAVDNNSHISHVLGAVTIFRLLG